MKGAYSVRIKRSAEKELRRLPHAVLRRLVAAIESLAADPNPPGCVRLSGRDAWRIRIGAHRVVYTVADDVLTVEVIRVAHRREAYR